MNTLPRSRARSPRYRRTVRAVGAAALLITAIVVPEGIAGAQQDRAGARADKGPVGWETYRGVDGLATMRPGEQARQFSSFDRTGGNNDGFEGTYSCLRQEADGRCVIAERSGAGEVSSMWFTYDADSVAKIGEITVELDGKVVLQGPLQDIVDGRKGAPFVWPLVGNNRDTMGGAVIKVPMPYRESMKITTQHNPHFYHVGYRQFPDAEGVQTFDPSDPAQDVVDRLRDYGVNDPKPAATGATSERKPVDVAPRSAARIAELGGPGKISQLRLRLPQVLRSPGVQDDGRAYGAGGGSRFTADVSPDNEGVRLTRRFDPSVGNQRAAVAVDGRQVGEWTSGPPAPAPEWADQALEVPADATAGKSQIEVSNSFVSSDKDINEFHYDVHSKVGGEWVRTDSVNVGPNNPSQEAAHGYGITAANWEGLRDSRYPAEPGDVAASDAIMEGARLRITFDGQTTVDAPLGEFFGSGLGKYDSRSLMHSVDVTDNGAFTSWWPMPYARDAVVEVVNDTDVPIAKGSLEVTSAPDESVAGELGPQGSLGYFHATHRRADTVNGQEWNFLSTPGRGVFYGVSHTMRGHIPPGEIPQLNFLEGDELVYTDGATSPSVHGTGTEDFYESGWYFQDLEAGGKEGVPYAMPFAGAVGHETGADGCAQQCIGAYRHMLAEAVPFGTGLRFDIEHGPGSDRPSDYSSTSYWYGQSTLALRDTDVVDTADDASRQQHQYRADGETRGTLESTFEGFADGQPVGGGTTAATGRVSFTVAVDEGNAGVRLRRLSDQAQGSQQAQVFVDDQPVGLWSQPLANERSRWLEDTFDLPKSATQGKKRVSLRIEPVAGAPAWSASKYTVQSHVTPYPAG